MEQLLSKSNNGNLLGDFARISPNPSKGLFEIAFAHADVYTIQIADLKGKAFYKMQTENISTQSIDLGNIAPGNYIIKIVSSSSAYTKKLTITN